MSALPVVPRRAVTAAGGGRSSPTGLDCTSVGGSAMGGVGGTGGKPGRALGADGRAGAAGGRGADGATGGTGASGLAGAAGARYGRRLGRLGPRSILGGRPRWGGQGRQQRGGQGATEGQAARISTMKDHEQSPLQEPALAPHAQRGRSRLGRHHLANRDERLGETPAPLRSGRGREGVARQLGLGLQTTANQPVQRVPPPQNPGRESQPARPRDRAASGGPSRERRFPASDEAPGGPAARTGPPDRSTSAPQERRARAVDARPTEAASRRISSLPR